MTKIITALDLIESLNQGVEEGKLQKEVVTCLKGGNGMCIVYTDTTKNPDSRVYASGKIEMGYGSTIGQHSHEKDWETYTVLAGRVLSNGKEYGPGETMICKKGESHHCKNIASGESVLRFVKRM